jgi:hypothetical protein
MAAATYIPAKLALSQVNGSVVIDFDTDTLKCMAVVAGSGRPSTSKTGVQYVSDVTGTNAEVTGTGYSRQTLASVTVSFDGTATNLVDFSYGNITFGQNAAGFSNGRYLVFFKDAGGADSANPVFAIFDPDTTFSAVSGDVIISSPTGGMIQWSVP